jgi:propanol-preferring alcohol dehydrogenase
VLLEIGLRPTSMRAMRIHGAKGRLHLEEVPVRKGGRVVCAGIHMSDIPSFPYSLLWGERFRWNARRLL